jgi:rhomboid family GlyGly-CTERM serine protease
MLQETSFTTSVFNRLPMITLTIAAVALLIGNMGFTAKLLQYDRVAIAAGEWWRAITGHLTHWSTDHLLWDVAVFATLGFLCEREGRRRFAGCTAASTVLITAGIWFILPNLETYRGLSGIDSALFALLAGSFLRDAIAQRRWNWVAGIAVPLAGFLGKTFFEIATGTTLFVDSAAANMVPIPLAHVIGACVGLAFAVCRVQRSRNRYLSGECGDTIPRGRFRRSVTTG